MAFGRHAEGQALIALCGQLGTGKTVFVKALAQGLGIKDVVTSPTFVLMNEYTDARLPLYHIDLYRMQEWQNPHGCQTEEDVSLKNSSELDAEERALNALDFLKAELQELTHTPSVVVIEWAEFLDQPDKDKSKRFLSVHDHITIALEYVDGDDSARNAEIIAVGETSAALVHKVVASFEEEMPALAPDNRRHP